jgi:hypothetical protein
MPVLAVIAGLLFGAAPSRADEGPLPGSWRLGLEIEQQSFETMSAGDSRPTSRAMPGARGSVDWLFVSNWALALSARFGGAWFDWTDPVYQTTGNIEDVSWDTRLGLDRTARLGAAGMARCGAGFEYGEARSWVHALGNSLDPTQDISPDGPHCYRAGGYARLGVMTPPWHRIALSAQVSESFYRAHAVDPALGTQFSWLGRSLSVSAGLTFEIAHGHSSRQ